MSTIGFSRCRQSSRARTSPAGFGRVAAIPLALIAGVVFGAAAQAATVRAVQGQVLVNAGQGYRLVDGSTELDPGGTVVANPGAVAEVVYPGGCKVTVQPGSVYLVVSQPPCQAANVERPPPPPARERPERTERTEDRTETANPSGGGISNGTAWTVGAIAVIGGGAAAYFLIPPLSP
jgi:hypothetical protein